MLNKFRLISLLPLLAACQFQPQVALDNDWQRYKERFVHADGRVIDTGNAGISHSEGQGFGMLLSVRNDDKADFDTIWRWSQQNLQVRKEDSLFIWRKRPNVPSAEEDMNNASDGDIIIAWALLEAAQKWREDRYRQAAADIIQDIKQKLVITWNGDEILLPGAYGFQHGQMVEINLSYWIFPAFAVIAEYDQDPLWTRLRDNGLQLLKRARFGPRQLPSDWLALTQDDAVKLQRSGRFGYDAIRIPLYLIWGEADNSLLEPYADYWRYYGAFTPAWIDLEAGVMDAYGASDGVKAIKQLTLFSQQRQNAARFDSVSEQDYYAATLMLLSKLCYQQISG